MRMKEKEKNHFIKYLKENSSNTKNIWSRREIVNIKNSISYTCSTKYRGKNYSKS